jgi:hypothetical protein
MTTKPILGWTDYPLYEHEAGQRCPTRLVEILSYDNNKYAKVRHLVDGHVVEVKTGYIFKNPVLTKNFPIFTWYLLGGGKRKNWRPREKKTTWVFYGGPNSCQNANRFDTLQKALRAALVHAKRIKNGVAVTQDRYQRGGKGGEWYGRIEFWVWPNGYCGKYRNRLQKIPAYRVIK